MIMIMVAPMIHDFLSEFLLRAEFLHHEFHEILPEKSLSQACI